MTTLKCDCCGVLLSKDSIRTREPRWANTYIVTVRGCFRHWLTVTKEKLMKELSNEPA